MLDIPISGQEQRFWLRPVSDATAHAGGRALGIREILPYLPASARGRDDLLFHSVRSFIYNGLVDGDVTDNEQTVTVRGLTPAGREVLGAG
jgi:hypothetical protein